jgi:hypothetical protein
MAQFIDSLAPFAGIWTPFQRSAPFAYLHFCVLAHNSDQSLQFSLGIERRNLHPGLLDLQLAYVPSP